MKSAEYLLDLQLVTFDLTLAISGMWYVHLLESALDFADNPGVIW